MIGAAVGAVAGVIVAIAGPLLLLNLGSLATESTSVGRDGLDDLELTLDQVVVILETTAQALNGVETIVSDGAIDLTNVSSAGSDLAKVVTGDVPDALDSVQRSLPAIEDTARVLDRTMRALSFVGVDYDTEVRLDEAIARLGEDLAPIPASLRGQAQRFAETTQAINDLATSALGVSARLDQVEDSLREVGTTLSGVDETAVAARTILDRIDRTVGMLTSVGALLAAAAGLGMATSQGSLWWLLHEANQEQGG